MKRENQLRDKIIDQLEQFLSSENFSIAIVCFFMQSIRVLLEIDELNSKYPVTNHYCNWLLHKELDRKKSPYIIKEIAQSFKDYNSKNDLIRKINNSIELKKLISELKDILWTTIPDKLKVSKIDFEDYWKKFIQVILNQILYRPIKLKKDHIEIDGFDLTIYGFQIVAEKGNYNIELLSKELERKEKRIIIDIALFR